MRRWMLLLVAPCLFGLAACEAGNTYYEPPIVPGLDANEGDSADDVGGDADATDTRDVADATDVEEDADAADVQEDVDAADAQEDVDAADAQEDVDAADAQVGDVDDGGETGDAS